MGRPVTWLFALVSCSLVAFGWVADRGLQGEALRAREEAKEGAAETARLAARSVGASLLSLEQVVAAGRALPGVVVERLAAALDFRVPAAGDVRYDRLPRSRLAELLGSTWVSPSGLPEAVIARLALGDPAALSLPGGEAPPDVAERLLSGALPVRPDDLPTLARALDVGSDPRVESLRARLLAAPNILDLPLAPSFRRSLRMPADPSEAKPVVIEGWARVERPFRVRYEVSIVSLVEAAHLPDDVTVVTAVSPAPAGDASADVPELPGVVVRASARRGGMIRVRVLRVGLWLAVIASIGLLLAVHRALGAQARATAREKRFLASVTHELRTPLAAMRLFGERLAQGLGSPTEYGALIAEESERLETLVERVLAATRASERPRFAPVDPAELMRSALALVAPRAERREVTLTCRTLTPLPPVTWDAEAVRRALLNLLDNAIRHGRASGRVEAAAFAEGDAVCLSVSDDGPGIGRREQKDVFARFARGHTDAPGTGLGLHFVEQVAHAHGGRVDLVSEEGRGCVFTLRLPAAPPPATPPAGEEARS